LALLGSPPGDRERSEQSLVAKPPKPLKGTVKAPSFTEIPPVPLSVSGQKVGRSNYQAKGFCIICKEMVLSYLVLGPLCELCIL
jgi:hypothetical protein